MPRPCAVPSLLALLALLACVSAQPALAEAETLALAYCAAIGAPADRLATDNNPDLVSYRGRGEFQLNWAHGKHTASLLYRSTLKHVKYGALQLEWTYPVYEDQPNGLCWYLQAFRGYGETLTDYNFRQTSIGAGLSFMQF